MQCLGTKPGVATVQSSSTRYQRSYCTPCSRGYQVCQLGCQRGATQRATSLHTISRTSRQTAVTCRAADDRQPTGGKAVGISTKFNPVYAAIFGAYAALLIFKNPYIYAVLTILTILPQNSNVTSLNNLVLLFYESGLFMNFAEAVTCVRLVTWLSMGFMVASFALFK